MTIFLLIVRLALTGVFLTAAAGKLLDRAGARQAMRDFGVPERLAPPAALLLPVAEIVVAIALVPPVTGWYGAIGALLLLAAFSAAIALSIIRGRAPDCHCFGQLGGGPVGLSTLLRNAGFGVLALVPIAAAPNQEGYGWITDLTSGEQLAGGIAIGALAVSGLAVALSALLLTRILAYRRRIEVLERDMPKPGLPVGDPAPAFALPTVSALTVAASSNAASSNAASPGANGASEGATLPATATPTTATAETPEEATLDAFRAGGVPVLVTFTSPTCGPCNEFYPELAEWQRDHAQTFTVALVGRGEPDENREKAATHALTNFVVEQHTEVSSSFRAQGTPVAVLVTAEGKIGSHVARGANEIRDLTAALRALSSLRT